MSNKEITFLMNNGKIKRKKENDIMEDDLKMSKYIMMRTYDEKDENRNFIINKISSLFNFDTAIIDYQIASISATDDDDSYCSMNPIHIETRSISDVLSLLNCVDRLNCINNIISNEENCGQDFYLDLEFFSVVLYKNNKVIYDKFYKRKDSSQVTYYSYKILKNFSEIYSTDICNDLFHDKMLLLLRFDMTWGLVSEKDVSKLSFTNIMVGIPLNQSNTFTFLTKNEYVLITSLKYLSYTFLVYESNSDNIQKINEYIHDGKYDDLLDAGMNMDYYMDSYRATSLLGNKRFMHVDFLSHMKFILEFTNILFYEFYKVYDNSSLENIYYESLISMVFSYNTKKEKEIYFSKDSVIPISQIIKLII